MNSSSNIGENHTYNNNNQSNVPIFAYELLRDILIPDIFGKDTDELSYWLGKHLARKFPLLSMEELISFFQEAAWGELTVIEETRNEMKLQLHGSIVERRIEMHQSPSFRLEAGFIAQQIQTKKNYVSEAYDEIVRKKKIVLITVRWDRKDFVYSEK